MAPDEPLAILRDDPHLIAVVKPAGLLTQGYAGGDSTLEDLVRRHLRPDDPASVYLGTVHRLDRPVSGVVVWAKTPRAARRLAAQFAGREVGKQYWALAEGPAAIEETWDDWLGPVDASGVARVVAEGSPGARRAVTRVRPLAGETPPGTAFLALEPETGRTHQLRAQASHRGRPIVGDAAYGSTRLFPRGIALHARSLRFEHPALRDEVRLEAPVPAAWVEFGIGWSRGSS
jgi:23S rRNA pseudouridine1911/1915/1917 synthase